MVSIRRHASNWRAYLTCGGLGLAAGFITISLALAAPPENPPAHGTEDKVNTQGQSETPNSQPHPSSLLGNSETAITQKSKDTTDQHQNESLPSWPDYVLALAGIGQLVFSGLLWLSTRKLWRETERLATGAEIQAEDFKISLKHTRIHRRGEQGRHCNRTYCPKRQGLARI